MSDVVISNVKNGQWHFFT